MNAEEAAELFAWMAREGFGCWHDARTRKWVSMAGCRFDTPQDAIRAAMKRCAELDA